VLGGGGGQRRVVGQQGPQVGSFILYLRGSGPCVVNNCPFLYGASSEIWYRQRHYDAVDTISLSLRHTKQAI